MTQPSWQTVEKREAWVDYHPPGSMLVHYSWPPEDTSAGSFESRDINVLLLIIGTNGFYDEKFRVILWNQIDQKLVEMTWSQVKSYVSLPEDE